MLQISHLYANYGGKPALEDINLTLESGELLVVLGPSGCGKTTLLNLIAGFVPYQHGSIQLAGKRIEGPGAERGVVFQNEGLLPWRNVQNNVAFGLQLAGIEKMQRLEIAHQMLKKVGLEGAEKRYIWQLSGGQRQRLAIASVLATNPSVLVLDEPTSSLDPDGTAELYRLVGDLNRNHGITVVVIDHDLHAVLPYANRMALMVDGEIVCDSDVATTLEYMYNHDIYVEALPSVFTTYMELEKAGYHSDEPWLSIESAIKGLHHIEMAKAIDRSRYENSSDVIDAGESQTQHSNTIGESTGGGAHA